jgi:hypothetical protein
VTNNFFVVVVGISTLKIQLIQALEKKKVSQIFDPSYIKPPYLPPSSHLIQPTIIAGRWTFGTE